MSVNHLVVGLCDTGMEMKRPFLIMSALYCFAAYICATDMRRTAKEIIVVIIDIVICFVLSAVCVFVSIKFLGSAIVLIPCASELSILLYLLKGYKK